MPFFFLLFYRTKYLKQNFAGIKTQEKTISFSKNVPFLFWEFHFFILFAYILKEKPPNPSIKPEKSIFPLII